MIQSSTILLDSRYRNTGEDLSWQLINTNSRYASGFTDVVSVRVDDFYIPFVDSAVNLYKKVTLQISELSAVSTAGDDHNYHIMMNSTVEGNRILLSTTVNNTGTFLLNNKVSTLNTFTLKLFSPFQRIVFKPDTYVVSADKDATTTLITFAESHGLSNGELVYISGFSTTDATYDYKIINTVNRANGHICTVVNDTTIRLDINISAYTIDPNSRINCYIASRRIMIPLTIRHIK